MQMKGANQEAAVSVEKITLVIEAAKKEGINTPILTTSRDMPKIGKKINDKLTFLGLEINLFPATISTVEEAIATFIQFMSLAKESRRETLVRREFGDQVGEESMHGTTYQLSEMVKKFSDELDRLHEDYCLRDLRSNFLETEINHILTSSDSDRKDLVHMHDAGKKKLEEEYSLMNLRFLISVWNYIEQVIFDVLEKQIGRYTHLHYEVRSLSYILLGRMRQRKFERMKEMMVKKETLATYGGYRHEFTPKHNRHVSECKKFIYGVLDDKKKPFKIVVEGIGEIDVEGLRKYSRNTVSLAFYVRMNEIAQGKQFTRTFVEETGSYLNRRVANLVDGFMDKQKFDTQMLNTPANGIWFKEMLEKYSSARKDLKKRIEKLIKAKEICEGFKNTSLYITAV